MAARRFYEISLSLIFTLALCYLAFRWSAFNSDMLSYACVCHAAQTTDYKAIHDFVFHAAAGTPLLDGRNSTPLFDSCAVDATSCMQGLPWFAVRPLYILLIRAFSAGLHVSLFTAMRLISVGSLFGIAALLYFWFNSPLALVVVCLPPIFYAARLGSPDMVSALTVVAAVFASRVLRRPSVGVLLLLLAVMIRTDNVLLVIALLFIVVPPRLAVGFSVFACALVALINRVAGSFPLSMLWSNSFGYPTGIFNCVPLTPAFYLVGLRHGVRDLLFSSIVLPIMLLGAVAWIRRWPHRDLAAAALCSLVARFFLFPDLQDRFFIAHLLLVIFAFSMNPRQNLKEQNPALASALSQS